MNGKPEDLPSEAVHQDDAGQKAPNPRQHYDSPEELAEDIELDLATREALLRDWQYDLERRLEAESEGMGTSDPAASDHARLTAEARRVSLAYERVSAELELVGDAARDPGE